MVIKAATLIKEKSFPNIILLYGKEDYLKRQFKNNLADAILPDKEPMNYSRFINYSGKREETDSFVSELISIASTLPMFSERRLIVCENTGLFKNKYPDFSEFLKSVPNTSFLIFSENEVSKATTAYKTVADIGFIEEYNMPDTGDLALWIKQRLKTENLPIERDALESFIERTAVNMDNMDKELSKLISYCLNKEVITLKDVEDICIATYEENIFEIINCIAEGDKKGALNAYSRLHELRVNPRSILALLNTRFIQLLNIKEAAESGRTVSEIGRGMKNKSDYIVKKNMGQASRFSKSALKGILELSSDYQRKMNTGLLNEETGVEMFILKSLRL